MSGVLQLPAFRLDLTGKNEEPQRLRWSETLHGLESRRPSEGLFRNVFAWLATSDPAEVSGDL